MKQRVGEIVLAVGTLGLLLMVAYIPEVRLGVFGSIAIMATWESGKYYYNR